MLLGAKNYACALDVWSVGCIFAELLSGRILFRGDSEIGQLYSIFGLLGTPTEQAWPGVTGLPDYKPDFPAFRARPLMDHVARLDFVGLQLLQVRAKC